MNNTFTLTDIVRFAYNETSPAEDQEIREALFSDPDLMDEYEQIIRSKMLLDESSEKPSQNVVNNILNYSKALSIRESKKHGKIELILN